MKKFLLLLFCSVAFGQASNQMVTFTQAQSLGFTLNAGQSHVTSNECMTKTQALSKYNLSSSSMSAYTSNQLVPRSAWVAGVVTPTSYDFPFSSASYTTGLGACNNGAVAITLYCADSIIVVGSILYTNSSLTTVFNGLSKYYYYIDNNGFGGFIRIGSAGNVINLGGC